MPRQNTGKTAARWQSGAWINSTPRHDADSPLSGYRGTYERPPQDTIWTARSARPAPGGDPRSKTGRQRRSLELVLGHVPAHWPALPRPAACGQQARPAAARGHRAAARPARLPRSDGASLPANRAGWLAPTRYLQPADDLAGVVHPAPSRAAQAPPPRRQGALIEAAILGGGLARRPGAKATRDTAMPAHSRTLFPEWRQPSPARFPCRGPAQANRTRRVHCEADARP